MSRATVTVRELKNKETGIDLSVTSFKETKGMLGSSYEYQVVVVSNLSCFKSAKHKETDNVQFTTMKKLPEFEELHAKFNSKFSGTAFPQLPKKVLMMSPEVAKERRNMLDNFVKFLASTPKLSTDPVLLEFLGVSSVKAGQLQKMEVSESIVNKQDDTVVENITEDNNLVENVDDDDLFGDNDGENDDDDDDDLFGTGDLSTDKDVKIFADQDFSGALEEGEGDDLFIEGSRSEQKVVTKTAEADQEEDNEDLFQIDDDLEDIMNMKLTTKTDNETEVVCETNDTVDAVDDSKVEEDISDNQIESVPVTKPLKPALKAKPALPKKKPSVSSDSNTNSTTEKAADESKGDSVKPGSKPKPTLKKKPEIAGKPAMAEKPTIPGKPTIAGKPNLKPKPTLKPKPSTDNGNDTSSVDVESVAKTTDIVEQISTGDDILKYIQDNAADDDDIDLFS